MSILSRIIQAICSDLYPKVRAVVDRAAAITEHVAAVAEEAAARAPAALAPAAETMAEGAEQVAESAAQVAESAAQLRERVEARAPQYGPMLEQILDAAEVRHEEETGEVLDWRQSIVDTIKLVNTFSPFERQIDPSFSNRQQLAREFGLADYRGTENDNIRLRDCFLAWLRQQ